MKLECKDGETTLWVYDPIGPMFGPDAVTAKGVREKLASLRGISKLNVRINSPGGEVDESMAIYTLLREFKGTVVTKVDGIAASAAATVFSAGEYRQVAQGAKVMIHNPWGIAVGDYRELQKASDVAKQYRADLAGVYSDRFGMKLDSALAAMDETTFYTADEAMVAGLATAVAEPVDGVEVGDGEALVTYAKEVARIAACLLVADAGTEAREQLSEQALAVGRKLASMRRQLDMHLTTNRK